MTPLQERIATVQRANEKWSWYPAVKAAARELLGNGIDLKGNSIQPLVFGSTKDALYSLPGIGSPSSPDTYRRGWVNPDAAIIAAARVRREGTEEWLSPQRYREVNGVNVMEDRRPREYATAFWLARY